MGGIIKISNDKITFECDKRLMIQLMLIPLFMFFSGIRIVSALIPFEEGYTGADVFGFVFVCVWTAVVGVMTSAFLYNFGKKTILDSEGITTTFLFYKKELEWREIQDYGISYCGQTRNEGNTYYLYFATEEQNTKNRFKKKLKGNMIKITVVGENYYEVTTKVIPFCQKKTSVTPFIAEDGFHII